MPWLDENCTLARFGPLQSRSRTNIELTRNLWRNAHLIAFGNCRWIWPRFIAAKPPPVTKQAMPGMEFGLLPHDNENVSGCLCKTEDNQPSEHGPLVYLSVEGRLDDAIRAVLKGGGKVLKEKHPMGPYGFRAVIRDTEGNRIALHSQAA